MMFPTDILRAALHCVASKNEPREYLQGVHITPTHIEATDGRAAVMMEHGDEYCDIDAVFIVHGDIPAEADGTCIESLDDGWLAIHYVSVDENKANRIGCNRLQMVECRYPDFSKLLPVEPEPCDEMPMFSSRLLALPNLMFDSGFVPVKFKPYGKSAPCQLILDPATNHLFGNPFLVIMPLHDNAFDLCAEVLNEKGI
ncbi:hypothetical protein [Serratia liquefaciens]|uniref:Uncharacterized protein n=1 Tax=Serratia liquefaciens TaxID=614 RepID=A0A515CSY9_SERLI|nr:hypothetical protein [Serratia liquefaciens]QDL31277.1 hypothetical protein EGO53_05555 [Serratia liquefaciens]